MDESEINGGKNLGVQANNTHVELSLNKTAKNKTISQISYK